VDVPKEKRRSAGPGASAAGVGGIPEPAGGLHVVTVAELSPDEFPGELGASYEQACAALRLPASPGGYGLVLDLDDGGARWTRAVTDVEGIKGVQSLWSTGMEAGYEPPDGTVAATLPGWPVDCGLGFAGLPEPHDPPGMRALRPPPERWGPARRRGMTDLIAGELADSGHQDPGEYHQARQVERWNFGETDLVPQEPRLIDLRARLAEGHPARPAVERAVTAAWRLAATAKPPPGSVRSRGAWPRPARVIRAAGGKWSLAGRTGGPVILLLDELAGVPVDISDTPRAAELLDALTAAADRAQRA
jgi:hypothetical protein